MTSGFCLQIYICYGSAVHLKQDRLIVTYQAEPPI